MANPKTDLNYLRWFPFLSNSADVTGNLDITIEKIEDTNIFDSLLYSIFGEFTLILNSGSDIDIKSYQVLNFNHEVVKFYLTIFVLKELDNIALTRIWVKYFLKRIKFHIKERLSSGEISTINFFLDMFRLLDNDERFKLKKITLDDQDRTETFGMHVIIYSDIASEIQNSDEERYQYLKLVNSILHKGYIIIGFHEIDLLSSFIEYFTKIKIFQMYNNPDTSNVVSKKINIMVKKLKDLIIESEKVSINIKKHHVPKELLYEREKIMDVEKSNIIIKDIIDNKSPNNLSRDSGSNFIPSLPPCVNVILEKIISKKIALSHNENILLCTYLAKKHFIKDHIVKIFSLATNYDKKVTDYQVRSLVDKNMMCMNCSNLQTEGICKKELDKTQQCNHIKNPLSFR